MPWINVIANASFGFLVSAEGGGYTWSLNSQQNPLTPWPNDPVSDAPHEVLYLRDEDSGELVERDRIADSRAVRDLYRASRQGLQSFCTRLRTGSGSSCCNACPLADSIKLSRLRIRNGSARVRRLSVTAYVEWALGANGTVPAPYIVTTVDAATGALFARNAWRAEFGDRVAFVDLGGMQSSLTADRTEFLGRHGTVDRPAALAHSAPLSGRVGGGLDPCAALQTRVELEPAARDRYRVRAGRCGLVGAGAGCWSRSIALPMSTR